MKQQQDRKGESGNVMVYILLAVTLLAALSFAIAEGGRTQVTSMAEERSRLAATDILDFSETIANAFSQIRLRGMDVTVIRFAHPDLNATYGTYNTNPPAEIFNPAGGQVIYSQVLADVTTTGAEDFIFLGNNEIQGVGSTCADADCADLIMAVENVKETVCQKINELLNVTSKNAAPPTDSEIDVTGLYDGTFTYDQTVGDEASELHSKKEACITNTAGGNFVYYKVLATR